MNHLHQVKSGAQANDPSKLPPCQDACKQHILHANYQVVVWHHFLEAKCVGPSPAGMAVLYLGTVKNWTCI